MSYTWWQLKNLSVDQLANIIIKENSSAKNLFLTLLAGPCPVDILPDDVLTCIYNRLDFKSQINWGRASKQFYPYIIETTKTYCCGHKNIGPLCHYDYSGICKIIRSWTDQEILSAVCSLNQTDSFDRIYTLSAIYQCTKDRKFWSLVNLNQSYPTYIRVGDIDSFNKALVSFPSFGYFMSQNFETESLYAGCDLALKDTLNRQLTKEELVIAQENLRQILNLEEDEIYIGYYKRITISRQTLVDRLAIL